MTNYESVYILCGMHELASQVQDGSVGSAYEDLIFLCV